MMPDWFTAAVQISQSVMLFVCGFFMLDSVRMAKRGRGIIDKQQALLMEMRDVMFFQRGLLVAIQAGVISPWQLQPIDLRDLPIETRIAILMALIDIGVQMHMEKE